MKIKNFLEKIQEMFLTSLEKVKDNRKNIVKFIVLVVIISVAGIVVTTLIIHLMVMLVKGIAILFDTLLPLLIVCGCAVCAFMSVYHKLYSQHQERMQTRIQKKQEEQKSELDKMKYNIEICYCHLKVFLFNVLSDRICKQLELFKPQTPDLLQSLNPIQIDRQSNIVFFNFTIQKMSELPLNRGLERTKHILSSVIMNQVRLYGIEGITPPTGDTPQTVLYVHDIVDRGLELQVTLVLNTEEYQKYMEQKGVSEEQSLIEYI